MKKVLLKTIIFIIIIITVFTLYGIFISTKAFTTNEIKIKTNLIEDNFDGFKIVHLSDIHYGTIIDKKLLTNIIKEVNLLKPDIVVITGDLLNNKVTYNDDDKNDIINLLKSINSNIGNYAIKGDNDSEIWDEIIEESNFININDTYNLIFNNGNIPMIISGISSTKNNNITSKTTDFEDYITNASIKPCYSILLIHEPDLANYINNDNYNLVLAGHSLGGINIPIIGRISIEDNSKKYNNGYYKIKDTDLYVSNGLGTNKYKFRLLNRPSINFYRIVK